MTSFGIALAETTQGRQEIMRAVAYLKPLPIEDAGSLVDIEVDRPSPSGKDLLVEVKAVSVNPVDTKRRRRDDEPGTPEISRV